MTHQSFAASEKALQSKLKEDLGVFSPAARPPRIGYRNGKECVDDFQLPSGTERDNLFAGYRTEVFKLFSSLEIKWHAGGPDRPNPHLCSSQVACVNFLAPFVNNPEAFLPLARGIDPRVSKVVPVESAPDKLYLTFEYIGADNYLGERMPKTGRRTRGAHFTSADAAVRVALDDSSIEIWLIEWKYTEHYGSVDLSWSKDAKTGEKKTDRRAIYRHLLDLPECLLREPQEHYEALFFEPFYQLFRQQALADVMERAHECDADRVRVLHLSPARNLALHAVTSPSLRALGTDLFEVWSSLLSRPDRFRQISTDSFFAPILQHCPPDLAPWRDYVVARYPSILGLP